MDLHNLSTTNQQGLIKAYWVIKSFRKILKKKNKGVDNNLSYDNCTIN